MIESVNRFSEEMPPKGLRYLVPGGHAVAELVIRNSVFVGNVSRARSPEEAEAVIDGVRARYSDAHHNAWAYRISGGPQAEIGSSDDGEPGGTAGRPMLAVLAGRELCEVVAVGTRYFGGTKLGTGGLVRAYGDCIRAALEDLTIAQMVYHFQAAISVEYSLYGALTYLLPQHDVRIKNEDFAKDVHLSLGIPYDQLETIAARIQELTNGKTRLADEIQSGYYVQLPYTTPG